MVNWKKLQDLNLEEVSIKTQIEIQFLEALVEKNFEILKRFNVVGFIKILSREYELDFTDFMEEYENYLNENNLNVSVKSKNNTITPKLDSYYPQKKFSFLPVIIIVVIVVIVAAGVYYYDNIKEFLESEENNINTSSVVNIVSEAESNLKNLGNIVNDNTNSSSEENSDTKNSDEQDTNEQIEEKTQVIVDENVSEKNSDLNLTNEVKTEVKVDENVQVQNNTENTELTDTKITEELLVSNDNQKQAEFKTNIKIWVGIIDLDTYRKTTSVKEGDFNVSLDKDKLILTGAAPLTLINEEGQEEKFPAGASKRFLIKDGTIKSITLAEFMKLNKGKEW